MSSNPIYQIPRSLVFGCDFLNFVVKEGTFHFLDSSFEVFPVGN